MTRDQDFGDLERSVAQALQELPLPRAPRTLVPRVLAAVAVRDRRPWYARDWSAWPWGWQMGSALAMLMVLACLVVMSPRVVDAGVAAMRTAAVGVVPEIVGTSVDVDGLATAAPAVAGAFKRLMQVSLPLVLFMYFTCLGLGVALRRIVAEEVAPS